MKPVAPNSSGFSGSDAPVFISPYTRPDGRPFLCAYRRTEGYSLVFAGIANFRVTADWIESTPEPGVDEHIWRQVQESWVATFQLELRGIRGLHASAVNLNGKAVGFLAASGHGKSTLAAAFLAAGCSLLSDDILAVEQESGMFYGLPGKPTIRLWSDQAAALSAEQFIGPPPIAENEVGEPDKLSLKLDEALGAFWTQRLVLDSLYILDRRPENAPVGPPQLHPVTRREAVLQLIKHSYLPRLTAGVGLEAERLSFFAKLTESVRVSRLEFSSGIDRLSQVALAVITDRLAKPLPESIAGH